MLLFVGNSFGQNVKIEITAHLLEIDGKEYSTYQFVNSNYSASRPTVVFVTSKDLLLELSAKLPSLLTTKQEYTDIWILGMTNLDQKNLSETDKKIIDNFFQQILKYRADNSLPPYTLKQLDEIKVFIAQEKEICKYINCQNKL